MNRSLVSARRSLALLVLVVAAVATPVGAGAQAAATRHLVFFADPPLVARPGVVAKAARRRAADPAVAGELGRIAAVQDARLDALRTALGRPVEPLFRYRAATNGVAALLTPGEARRVAALPGVRAVVPDGVHRPDTDAGPAWVGAPAVWDGSGPGALLPTRGEGIVVGVLDSGINHDHPSFGDAPPDGHVYVNPYGPGVHLGWCDPVHESYVPGFCNEKLVGAWDFVDFFEVPDGPEDANFHGSHVAGIAVGNDLGFPPVSGVAPHAAIVAYDVCYGFPGTCPTSAIVAAVDQAVLDGVDVLNMSLGGGSSPWTPGDLDDVLRGAVAAGIVVVTSAGNDGPMAETVGHRGPWLLTVAAASHDREKDRNFLADLSGGMETPPADLEGRSLTDGYGPAPIVDGGTCASFAPGTFSGQIVVCEQPQHRTLADWTRCEQVAIGGGGGCVLAPLLDVAPIADFHALPTVRLAQAEGAALRAWLASGGGHTATITPVEVVKNAALGDVVAGFSSRGPNPVADVLKPDLTAPGVDVLSAYRSGLIPEFGEFLTSSGTSMAAPHVAGAAALLRALHPGWTPAEVASALVTTAAAGGLTKAVADPFDRGAGRLDVAAAAAATLVLDETDAAFVAADPAAGGDPRTLNVPSLVVGDCFGVCTWGRTVESALDVPATWTASVELPSGLAGFAGPPVLVLGPGASAELLVQVTASVDASFGAWAFGAVVLTPDDAALPVTRLPIAVVPTGYVELLFTDGFESGDVGGWSFARHAE